MIRHDVPRCRLRGRQLPGQSFVSHASDDLAEEISIESSGMVGPPEEDSLPWRAARIPAALQQQNVFCSCRSSTCEPCELACHLHPLTAVQHVDIDNIHSGRRPHCWAGDGSMMTFDNNSKQGTPCTDTYHHGDLRRALIQTALELAAEGNGWNFSLREVARRAGVSHSAPYNHFAHKRDLLDAAAAAGHDLLRSELTAAVAKIGDPRAALSKMGSTYIGFGIRNPALYSLMFRATPSGTNPHPERALAAWLSARAVLENILRRGARIGIFDPALTRKSELQSAALYMWAVVHGLTTIAIDGLASVEHLSIERITQKVLTTTLRGLAGGEASTNGTTI